MERKNPEQKAIKETIKKLLKLLEIEGDFEIIKAGEEIEIVLTTKDGGIVIGYHGEILEALQLILSLCISKKIGHFIRVSLEVGDYKKERTNFLENLALQMKERVLEESQEVALSDLKSWERRIIHVFLQEDKDVASESTGVGKDRKLVIKPRSAG